MLGIGWEKITLTGDTYEWTQEHANCKMMLGKWVWNFLIPLEKKQPVIPEGSIRVHTADETCGAGE